MEFCWRFYESDYAGPLQAYAEFIVRVDTVSGAIEVPPDLPLEIPPGLSKSIMIRPCYLLVLKKLGALGNSFALVLSGSPGIGKSAFSVLLLQYLAKRGAKVAYRYKDVWLGDTVVYFDFSDLSSIFVKVASVNTVHWIALLGLARDESVWQIQDGQAPRAQSLARGRHIVLSSSNVDDFREFAKGNRCEVWWLPVWSLEELQQCRRLLFPHVSEQVMESRFLEFGGLIRFVLANPKASFQKLAATLSAEQAFSLYHLTLASVESDVRHVFAHIAVDDNLDRTGYFLGSPDIKELVFAKSQAGQWQGLVEMLHAGAKETELGRMSGEALETYGHAVLLRGLDLDSEDVRQIFRQGPEWRPRLTGELTSAQMQTIAEIRESLRGPKTLVWDSPSKVYDLPELTQTYVQPITATNESWDSLICSGDATVNAVQFTRNTRHGTKVGGIQELLRRLRASCKKLRIFHAVPAEVYDTYTWQPWVGERAVQRKNKKGVEEMVSKVGTLSEDQVPTELRGIEQWVVKLRLPEPGSDTPNLSRAFYYGEIYESD
ncbi:hypothetical protein KFL_003360110 [Klebsormidium nitens]|uniref:Uncharacterized protein n=1 Tax=Klebsormidium nitens TaxID=105231 RepID=A0A1Y1ICL0_KLENI|nr:hypothetical protein KFL_003360110 [Klebsormidium nitens]|eukprot:GAQ87179.1 hypothetical protein KFL_003360110 [Klebsormidium nitens]